MITRNPQGAMVREVKLLISEDLPWPQELFLALPFWSVLCARIIALRNEKGATLQLIGSRSVFKLTLTFGV